MWFWWLWFAVAAFIARSMGCRFPSRWTGVWYQKGVHPPIRIEGDSFSFKGSCVAFEGDLFLIEDRREQCVRCVVIYEKHPNVLQYRETYCDEYSSLQEACSALHVDAQLFSLFRVKGPPVTCPFRGPFTFTYSRGQGECQYPLSTVDTCTDDSRLVLRFQACADVLGTESSVEELTCLATWKEGSTHYLVGKLVSNQRKTHRQFKEEDHYRCFVYENLGEHRGFQVSHSSDSTCDGLVTPWEGSRVLRLTMTKPPMVGCLFPPWATGPHRWHTLDSRKSFVFGHKNTTLRIVHSRGEFPDSKITCSEEIYSAVNTTTVVAYSIAGCSDAGYVCMTFHRRDGQIFELQVGDLATTPQEACQVNHFDPIHAQFLTLVTPSSGAVECPPLALTNGLRVQTTAVYRSCRGGSQVSVVGCQNRDTLEFLTTCATYREKKTFRCHGGWDEDDRSYLIAELRGSRSKYCMVFSLTEKVTYFSGLHDTCHRSVIPGITGNLTYNISSAGECEELVDSGVSVRLSLLTLFFSSSWTIFKFLVSR